MILAGAGGHARELIGLLAQDNSPELNSLVVFDDITPQMPAMLWDCFPVVRTATEVKALLHLDKRFALAVGEPSGRKILMQKFLEWGGEPVSIISAAAQLAPFGLSLGKALNIMQGAVISPDVSIGDGSLIHMSATVHHDVQIGKYCEISPGAHVLGRVTIGDACSIGAGAVILPRVQVGDHCIIGAGAVVTKNLEPGSKVVGVPARPL